MARKKALSDWILERIPPKAMKVERNVGVRRSRLQMKNFIFGLDEARQSGYSQPSCPWIILGFS